MNIRFALVFCAFVVSASAATSTAWQISGFSDFAKGRLTNLSVTSDGVLQPGPSIIQNLALGQPAVWSVAAAPDGLYVGTGHEGKLLRVAPDGKSSVLFSAPQAEIFAVGTNSRGEVYFASSPNGSLYKWENGAPRLLWRSPAQYIWAIAAAPGGSLFVATGQPGRIYRVDEQGNASLFFDTQQANVTALALEPSGALLAGTDPNGILYRISAPDKATILYDSSLPEIHSIVLDTKGNIYAAAMGGAVSSRSAKGAAAPSTAAAAVTAASPTIITVTEASESASIPAVVSDPNRSSGVATTSGAAVAPVVEVSGAEKSAIYKIKPDGGVDTIRSSKDDNIYDLLLDDGGLLFSTDDRSRIYRLNGPRTTLIAEPGDGEATRLLRVNGKLFAALSNPGRLIAFGEAASSPAAYQSLVHDSASVAHWGHLQWYGVGAGVRFQTRTGNSARPDSTWSPWSPAIMDSGSLISSPVARFIQWRAEWPKDSNTQLTEVDVPYLPQNGPPVVRSITVSSVAGSNAQKASSASNVGAAYSITVTDTGEAPPASSSTSASQFVSRLQTNQTQISWQADDPDGDKLAYSVYFRPEEESVWQFVRSRMFENTLLLDPDVFADGRYFFRVIASDSPSNPPNYAQEAQLVSSPVLIDNTPPLVTVGQPVRNGAVVDFDVDARDATSPLRLCEFSVDAGSWQPVESTDGVTDSPSERFHIHIEKLKPGEHLVVVRVYDSPGNVGLARAMLR